MLPTWSFKTSSTQGSYLWPRPYPRWSLRDLAVPSRADLTGQDLRHHDLTGADLTGADLTGADLTGATGLDT